MDVNWSPVTNQALFVHGINTIAFAMEWLYNIDRRN
jgi:hypothetical protein